MKRILIVDDELNILRSLNRLLMDEDYDIMNAQSGSEALKVLEHNRDIVLIISDMCMPGMTGAELLGYAREILPDAVRIILTGHSDVRSAVDAINKGGASRYITKPWNDNELIQIIRDCIKNYDLISENKRLSGLVKKQNDELREWNKKLAKIVQEQTVEILKKNERLKENFNASILAFTELIELREKSVRNHSKNVSEISVRIAASLQLSSEEIETIRIASLLHDIGKIGISDELLQKRFDEMKAMEIKEYMLHPVRGQAAIDTVEDLRPAGILVRHHHERFNGAGFPDGLRGKDIPLGARIISVADFVDRNMGKFSGEHVVKYVMGDIKKELVRRFDPQLYNLIEEPVSEIYKKTLSSDGAFEKEFHIEELAAGMVISRDIVSGTGFHFLSKGTVLDEKNINAIKRYYQIDPSRHGIFVFIKK